MSLLGIKYNISKTTSEASLKSKKKLGKHKEVNLNNKSEAQKQTRKTVG